MPAMFVNLPVTNLERAKAFYTAIGFTIDFADHNAARVVMRPLVVLYARSIGGASS